MAQDQQKDQKMHHHAGLQERHDPMVQPQEHQVVLREKEHLRAQEEAVPPAQAVPQELPAHVALIPLLPPHPVLVPHLQSLGRGQYGDPGLALRKQRLLAPEVAVLPPLLEQRVDPALLLPVAEPAAQQLLHSQELHAGLLLQLQPPLAEFQHLQHARAAQHVGQQQARMGAALSDRLLVAVVDHRVLQDGARVQAGCLEGLVKHLPRPLSPTEATEKRILWPLLWN